MKLSQLEWQNLSTENLTQLLESKREFIKQTSDINEKAALNKEAKNISKLLELSQLLDVLKSRKIFFTVEEEGRCIIIENPVIICRLDDCTIIKDGISDKCDDFFTFFNSI